MNNKTDEMSDYELLRLKNIEENRQKMIELGLISESKSNEHFNVERACKSSPRKKSCTRKQTKNVASPNRRIETRQSKRLSLKTFNLSEFSDEVSVIFGEEKTPFTVSKDTYFSNDVENNNCEGDNDSEKRKRRSVKPRTNSHNPRDICPVEKITEEDLDNIATSSGNKKYCQTNGTTCHQCRQKTIDQKTICRGSNCFGVRGQFCGPCLINRYGESARDALKNPEWTCPPCRKICNCSICRNNAGKMPTGQMAPWAFEKGFKSVKECLEAEGED